MKIAYNIGIWIVSGLYSLASVAFEMFLVLANGTLITEKSYNQLINNAYILISVVMLFILAFSILRGMVDPENKKQGTSVVKKVIINILTSGIILVLLPTIFTFAFDFQRSFINDYNVIGRFFGYGTGGSIDDNTTIVNNSAETTRQANRIVNGVFTAFFNVNSEYCEVHAADIKNVVEQDYPGKNFDSMSVIQLCQLGVKSTDSVGYLGNNFSFDATSNLAILYNDFGIYGAFSQEIVDGKISFNFLFGLLAGLLLIYVAVSFCFDMALRLIKLTFYQIIAPIPLFFRIIPDGKLSDSFKNWLKITSTCYLEVYIRILVFYFCIYLCNQLLESPLFDTFDEYNFLFSLIGKAFVYMGLITFMRQAPKLFSEVTGLDSGNMKLGIKDKLAAGGGFVAGAALGAGATAMVRNAANARNKFQEAQGFGGKAKALGRGILSTFAGAGSGLIQGGKAGTTSKNFKDMRKAAGTGAKSATDARNRREAYRIAHANDEGGVAGAWVQDRINSVKDWAGGGFEADEAKLKSYNELLAVQDKAKAATEKIMTKYGTNSALKAKNVSYKGVNNSLIAEYNQLFNDPANETSLATIESTIASLRNQKLEKQSYTDQQGHVWTETEEEFSERVRKHNERIDAFNSLYQQQRKATIKNIQSLAMNESEYLAAGLKKEDVAAIETELKNAETLLNAMGRGNELDLNATYGDNTGAGWSFDEVASNIEYQRDLLARDVARKKAERESRQQNSGS